MMFCSHYKSYLSNKFILACHIGLCHFSAESSVKVDKMAHIQTQFLSCV